MCVCACVCVRECVCVPIAARTPSATFNLNGNFRIGVLCAVFLFSFFPVGFFGVFMKDVVCVCVCVCASSSAVFCFHSGLYADVF